MAFLEFFTVLSSHPSLGLISALTLTFLIADFWLTYKVYLGQKQIKYTLYGNRYEKDVNGHGLYQKVNNLEEQVEGDDN